jgi:heptaprenyl diphosphate synthase
MRLPAEHHLPSDQKAVSAKVVKLARLAMLVAAGSALFLFESAIPRPLPWLKPGLSNLVTLIALCLYGVRAAFLVLILRVIIGALILGTLFNPAFLFALGGGIVSTSLMALAWVPPRKIFSLIGVSLIGAFSHNLTQLCLAAVLVIQRTQVFYLLPIMLWSSFFSGFLVGIFAHFIVQKAHKLHLK